MREEFKFCTISQTTVSLLHSDSWGQREGWRHRDRMSKTCSTVLFIRYACPTIWPTAAKFGAIKIDTMIHHVKRKVVTRSAPSWKLSCHKCGSTMFILHASSHYLIQSYLIIAQQLPQCNTATIIGSVRIFYMCPLPQVTRGVTGRHIASAQYIKGICKVLSLINFG